MAYNKYQGNNKDEDFTVVIDDSNFEQNPENQGSNHDNVSLVILSDLEPTINTGNGRVSSDGENDDGIPPAMEDGENRSSAPQQRNVQKTNSKSKSSGTIHWLRSKLGRKPVEPVGPDGSKGTKEPDGNEAPEESCKVQVDVLNGNDKDKQLM